MEQLTKREEEVMNKFWEKGEASVKEIIATYPEPRPSRTAISTFVKFLVDKGFLGHKPAGNNGFIYYPIIEREEYCGNNLKYVVQRYFNNSYLAAIFRHLVQRLALRNVEHRLRPKVRHRCKADFPTFLRVCPPAIGQTHVNKLLRHAKLLRQLRRGLFRRVDITPRCCSHILLLGLYVHVPLARMPLFLYIWRTYRSNTLQRYRLYSIFSNF